MYFRDYFSIGEKFLQNVIIVTIMPGIVCIIGLKEADNQYPQWYPPKAAVKRQDHQQPPAFRFTLRSFRKTLIQASSPDEKHSYILFHAKPPRPHIISKLCLKL